MKTTTVFNKICSFTELHLSLTLRFNEHFNVKALQTKTLVLAMKQVSKEFSLFPLRYSSLAVLSTISLVLWALGLVSLIVQLGLRVTARDGLLWLIRTITVFRYESRHYIQSCLEHLRGKYVRVPEALGYTLVSSRLLVLSLAPLVV